ncbi:MAG: hypothetical protein L3J09_01730 [Flavobacteriaceae bacterium]|nr:hypothetical protein [Flavobacteriaceae bacterium]
MEKAGIKLIFTKLYFGGINPNETIQLIYRDQLYNNGIFKFKFNEIPFKT